MTKDEELQVRVNALSMADSQIIHEMVEKVRALTIMCALKDEKIKELEDAANNAAPSPAAE